VLRWYREASQAFAFAESSAHGRNFQTRPRRHLRRDRNALEFRAWWRLLRPAI